MNYARLNRYLDWTMIAVTTLGLFIITAALGRDLAAGRHAVAAWQSVAFFGFSAALGSLIRLRLADGGDR